MRRFLPKAARSALLCLGLIGALIAATPARVAAATAKEITDQIKKLTTAIGEFDEKDTVSVTEINTLIHALLDAKLIGYNKKPSFMQLSTELETLLNDAGLRYRIKNDAQLSKSASDLAKNLDKLDADEVVKTRFVDLLKKLTTLIETPLSNRVVLVVALKEDADAMGAHKSFDAAWSKIDRSSNFTQLSTGLQKFLDDADFRKQINSDDRLSKSASDLATKLDTLDADKVVTTRFTDLLTKLTNLIKDPPSNRVVLATAVAEMNDKENSARGQFDKAWSLITDTEMKIHVVNSWFGDLRTQWREGRLCRTTSSIRKLCEKKPDCPLPAAPGGSQQGNPFDLETLCGYDPAPLVDIKHKGVVIRYTCVRGGQHVWDKVAQYPGTDPATGTDWQSSDIYKAALRSSGMSIRCPFPIKKAAGAGN